MSSGVKELVRSDFVQEKGETNLKSVREVLCCVPAHRQRGEANAGKISVHDHLVMQLGGDLGI